MNTDIDIDFLPCRWQVKLDLFFLQAGQGVNAYLLKRERLESLASLNALTDAELARMGLARDDIPAFVFEDILAPPVTE